MNRPLLAIGLLFLALAAPAFATDCESVTFTLDQTISGYPSSVAELQTVDYDHDGKLDLVGTIMQNNGDYGVLHSWRGVGDGTFEAAVSLGDVMVWDLQVANVNNDAYDDLVGASQFDRFFVRLGNATGFDPAIITSTNYTVNDIQAGNFGEGTGHIDVVTSSVSGGLFAVYQGNGDGTFTETRRVTFDSSNWVTDSAMADFDGDGRFDVALGRRMSKQLEVYFRNVDGTFAAPVSMSTGDWSEDFRVGDFNEDGLPDLASATWEDGTIEVFRNLGSRTFSARQILAGSPPGTGGNVITLQIVDVNADSHLDILGAAVNGGWLTTHLGNGDGTFNSANWFDPGDQNYSVQTGNFDGDADLEAALGGFQQLYTVDYTCATQVHLYSISPMITVGQTAKFRTVVSGISSSTPLPLGTVTFKDGATTLGTVAIDATGSAALDQSGLSEGDHTITAEFSGNSVLGPASATMVQKVTLMTTETTITLGASTHGEPFNSTVTIRNTNFNFTFPAWYYLTVDGITESAKRWSGATLTLTLSAGPHTISAEYLGGPSSPPSTSQTYNFTTAKHLVSISKSGDTTVRQGTAHSIQITVGATTSPTPTGTVELLRGATSIGSAPLVGGVASFNPTLPRGSYEYTAVYSGDTNYLSGSGAFTLNVLPNAPLVIDARASDSTVFIPAVVPNGTTATTMYRRVSGSGIWSAVPSWTLVSQVDDGTGMTRGVVYDYRLDATVSGGLQQSNIDSALLFTDPTLTAGSSVIKVAHFTELRTSINILRTAAGLSPFSFDGTFGLGASVRATHMSAMRTAVNEARTVLGLLTTTFTDGSLPGVHIKKVHVTELREASK